MSGQMRGHHVRGAITQEEEDDFGPFQHEVNSVRLDPSALGHVIAQSVRRGQVQEGGQLHTPVDQNTRVSATRVPRGMPPSRTCAHHARRRPIMNQRITFETAMLDSGATIHVVSRM